MEPLLFRSRRSRRFLAALTFASLAFAAASLVLALPLPGYGAPPATAAAPGAPAPPAGADSDSTPLLRVRGEASVTARPDTAVVRLGVWSQGQTARNALASASQAAARVLEAVERLGIARRHVQTRSISLSPLFRHDKEGGKPELTGYEARHDLEVTVEQLDLVGKLVDDAVAAGANRVESIRFTVRSVDAVKEQALRQAVADALQQARWLAEAAGARLGPLRSMDEVQFYGPPEVGPLAGAALEAARPPVVPGELEFRASVLLSFALE